MVNALSTPPRAAIWRSNSDWTHAYLELSPWSSWSSWSYFFMGSMASMVNALSELLARRRPDTAIPTHAFREPSPWSSRSVATREITRGSSSIPQPDVGSWNWWAALAWAWAISGRSGPARDEWAERVRRSWVRRAAGSPQYNRCDSHSRDRRPLYAIGNGVCQTDFRPWRTNSRAKQCA